jgi:hypothetical protein
MLLANCCSLEYAKGNPPTAWKKKTISPRVTARGNQVLRIGLLVAMALNVFAVSISPT